MKELSDILNTIVGREKRDKLPIKTFSCPSYHMHMGGFPTLTRLVFPAEKKILSYPAG
jgi:hypothetical protein